MSSGNQFTDLAALVLESDNARPSVEHHEQQGVGANKVVSMATRLEFKLHQQQAVAPNTVNKSQAIRSWEERREGNYYK